MVREFKGILSEAIADGAVTAVESYELIDSFLEAIQTLESPASIRALTEETIRLTSEIPVAYTNYHRGNRGPAALAQFLRGAAEFVISHQMNLFQDVYGA